MSDFTLLLDGRRPGDPKFAAQLLSLVPASEVSL
jgi:hypothetical protein